MKPEQKFILSCRQTSEAAARLGDWLDHNSTLLGAGHSAVREDIEWISARLTPLAAAAETVPGIGLLASQGTSKTDLLFAILGARAPTTLGQLGQRPVDAATNRGQHRQLELRHFTLQLRANATGSARISDADRIALDDRYRRHHHGGCVLIGSPIFARAIG